jgi:serine palmitoyltransferase
LNVGSYNYLGFGDPDSPTKDDVFKALEHFSVGSCSPRNILGTTVLHKQLEQMMASFLSKEDCLVFGMGFGTNAGGIPALIGKGGLIISDERNHSSIVVGARCSGAAVRVFKHNDTEDLEAVIRRAIVDGQPLSHRPWTRILIMIEGIYSMEGEMPPLQEIVRLKKKYHCYLYVDEAHSIGALGRTGRGICEQLNVSTADVDILMGTFTKSFGAVGGYLAASKEVITYTRNMSYGSVYATPLSPPACQQVISALRIMTGEDGTNLGREKLRRLRENSNLFRLRMKEMGCHVLGDWDSPICPVVLYAPGKVPYFSRACLEKGLAVVVVGYPATPLMGARSRFCISAAHTREDIEQTLRIVGDVIPMVGANFEKKKKVHIPPGLLLPAGTQPQMNGRH